MTPPKELTDRDLVFLRELEALIYERKNEMPEGSYTTTMFNKGLDKIAQKVGEEAVETVIASKNKGSKETIEEASDLLFHLMLLLAKKKSLCIRWLKLFVNDTKKATISISGNNR